MKIRLIPEYECGYKEYTKAKILFYNNNNIIIHFSLFRESSFISWVSFVAKNVLVAILMFLKVWCLSLMKNTVTNKIKHFPQLFALGPQIPLK